MLASAAVLWLGVIVSPAPMLAVSLTAVATVVAVRVAKPIGWVVVAAFVLGIGSGLLVAERRTALENTVVDAGRVEAVVEAKTDVIDGEFGAAIVATAVDVSVGQLPRGPLIVSPWNRPSTVVGERYRVPGLFTPSATRIRRSFVAGRLSLARSERARNRLSRKATTVITPATTPRDPLKLPQ